MQKKRKECGHSRYKIHHCTTTVVPRLTRTHRARCIASHLALDELGDALRGRVRAVGGAEGVVDVVVTQRGKLLAERLVVALP